MKNTHVRKNHRLLMPAVASLVVAVGLGWGVDAHAQVVKGSGTTNTIPVWTNSTTIGNSLMKQSGGNVNVSGGLVATNLSGNGSGVTNVNAATLGGLLPSAFAQVGASNTFTADQTMNGNLILGPTSNLTLGGLINNSLLLQGNVSDSSGNESANVIGGFGGSSSVTANSVLGGVIGATIAGGGGFSTDFGKPGPNTITGNWGTVGGGYRNTAGLWATVSGGQGNTASGSVAMIGGGQANTASGSIATVGGGTLNTASAEGATVAGGGGNTASGIHAVVPGGFENTAAGNASFAAGHYAKANNDGSFVWSDLSLPAGLTDTGPNSFVARASGGFTFYTAPGTSTGAYLPAGSGSWASLSDRNTKANFSAVDGQALLARLAALPIATWNYKAQPDSIRHMGPTAQDFRAAFGLGEDERHISTVDAQGVALAAIQALYETVTDLKRDLGDKDQQIVELRARLAHLEQQQ